MPQTPILEFRNISKRFGAHQAVADVSLPVADGEILALLGPSGCGKTTLLRMAAGFESADGGSILLEGKDITHLPPNRRALNTIFQNYALFPHLSVAQNIAFGPKLAGWPRARIQDETDRLLELVQLGPQRHQKPETLSGGQQQRVALARALILQPRVLLLDEPFAALDLKLRQRMLLELERLQREVGITFVFVTHDQGEAMSISHRVAVMNQGRILQVGSPREIYRRPRDRFVAGFIGEANLWDGVLAADEAGNRWLETDQGRLAPIGDSLPEARPGTRLTLCLRPEDLEVNSPNGSPHPRGKVVDTIYQGAYSHYIVVTERGHSWTVWRGPGQDPQPEFGQEVALSWSKERALLLASDEVPR